MNPEPQQQTSVEPQPKPKRKPKPPTYKRYVPNRGNRKPLSSGDDI